MGVPKQKIIRELEGKLNSLKAFYDSLLLTYKNIDLRATTIAAAGNTLRSHLFFMSMAEFTITRTSWWQEAYGKPYPTPGDQEAWKNQSAWFVLAKITCRDISRLELGHIGLELFS